jgi:hypothetical protein
MKAQTELFNISLEGDYEVTSLLLELKKLLSGTKESHKEFPLAHNLKYILEKEVVRLNVSGKCFH